MIRAARRMASLSVLSSSLSLVAAAAAPSAARAAPAPVVLATCGDSAIEVTPAAAGESASLRGVVAAKPGERWVFTASIGQARLGDRTRTIGVEDLHTVERVPPRAKDAAPGGLFIDFLVDDRKVLLRHASEGGEDPAYAVDLAKCSFAPEGEATLAALAPPPVEPMGCGPDAIRAGYRRQILRVAKVSDADAEREAKALCEDHQKTMEARSRLERAISDRAARTRITARGAALIKSEDARIKAWTQVDGCLGDSDAASVAALHDAEARARACYARIAVKP
jgi:hypothetical protein